MSLFRGAGENTIDKANETLGYCRKSRPQTHIKAGSAMENQSAAGDFEETVGDIGPEGTFYQLYFHPHPDWRTNSNDYSFDSIVKGSLTIEAKKHSDCTFELEISGVTEQLFKTRQPITQAAAHNDVGVAFSWGGGEITVYVNGKQFVADSSKQ